MMIVQTHFILELMVVVKMYQLVTSDLHRLSSRVVTTKYGALRGSIGTLSNHKLQSVEVFLGVPYASAPVGSLRFMPPVTPPHWKGVKNADQFGSVCPQRLPDITNETEALRRMPSGRLQYLRRLLPYLVNQSEDCLYLNIYAPAVVGREPIRLPVMVYIHGESYEWNSGNPYDGSVLASFGSVVVVTINYRLGVLGFLPALDGSSRGNYGLMDQVAALHWIQENIGEFGGDANNVTIFGQGYGAACVNLLMISPMAKGLFQRAIMQSGSALSPWAIAKEPLLYTHRLAEQLHCPTHEKLALLDCLRHRSVSDIMKVSLAIPDYLTAFGPTVDGVVIPNEPLLIMEDAKSLFANYDLLLGVNRVEAYFQFSSKEAKNGIESNRRDRMLRTLVRNVFSYHLQQTFLTIVNEYTDWTRSVPHPISTLEATADALGDALIVAPVIKVGNLHSFITTPTYLYVFNYKTEEGDYRYGFGCIHGEELPYVFGSPLIGTMTHFPQNYTENEVSLSETIMSYWLNFAKYGDPNYFSIEEDSIDEREKVRSEKLTWPMYNSVHQQYLYIGPKPKIRDHYHAHRLSFWLNLIPKLHDPPDADVPLEHHLLEDHHNLDMYDGEVRQIIRKVSLSSTISPSVDTVSHTSSPGLGNNSGEMELSTSTTSLSNNQDKHATITSSTNLTDSLSVMMQQGAYSTALSVTIAIGCSLLVLNVLIFAGVYYQRDKNKLDTNMWKRNYQVRRPNEGDMILEVPTKNPTMALPTHVGQYPLAQDYPSPLPSPSQKGNPLPQRMSPKVASASPKEALPEAQPLLPYPGPRMLAPEWQGGQELRVHFKDTRQETTV
ncbi:neuroligin-4, X-linked-like isoform X1 [Centruroides vittatus]|uniref:neuroligin-4, X-linked-like isoform X1 n=2 Tax=Centruroides vittatus TaxID=120091 RepID=UPI00350F97A1